jgi:hypothetical protein
MKSSSFWLCWSSRLSLADKASMRNYLLNDLYLLRLLLFDQVCDLINLFFILLLRLRIWVLKVYQSVQRLPLVRDQIVKVSYFTPNGLHTYISVSLTKLVFSVNIALPITNLGSIGSCNGSFSFDILRVASNINTSLPCWIGIGTNRRFWPALKYHPTWCLWVNT